MSDIEESAMYGNPDHFHEGIYTDSIVISDAERLTLEVEEEVKRGTSMKDALLKAIRKNSKVVQNGALARGKNKKATGDVTGENIIDSKRKRQKILRFDRVRRPTTSSTSSDSGEKLSLQLYKGPSSESGETKLFNTSLRKGKGKMVAKVGDLIYVQPEIFDDAS